MDNKNYNMYIRKYMDKKLHKEALEILDKYYDKFCEVLFMLTKDWSECCRKSDYKLTIDNIKNDRMLRNVYTGNNTFKEIISRFIVDFFIFEWMDERNQLVKVCYFSTQKMDKFYNDVEENSKKILEDQMNELIELNKKNNV